MQWLQIPSGSIFQPNKRNQPNETNPYLLLLIKHELSKENVPRLLMFSESITMTTILRHNDQLVVRNSDTNQLTFIHAHRQHTTTRYAANFMNNSYWYWYKRRSCPFLWPILVLSDAPSWCCITTYSTGRDKLIEWPCAISDDVINYVVRFWIRPNADK